MKPSKNSSLITAIVPVFNNQTTVKRVIKAILESKKIQKIIAIDDCSSDKSVKILQAIKNKKYKVVTLPFNHGKGRAIENILDLVKTDLIMVVDADLSQIETKHLENLIDYYFENDYDLVIMGRQQDGRMNITFIDYLSGERIFPKKNILYLRPLLKKVNNGFEQIVNYSHKDKKVKLIYSHNIGHINRYERYPLKEFYKVAVSYTKEGWDLLKTEMLYQVFRLTS